MTKDINIFVLEGSKRILPYKDLIVKTATKAVDLIFKRIPISDVDVVFYDNPRGVIPEIGMGGQARTSNVIFITLDPNFNNFEKVVENETLGTLAHEFHHTLRGRNLGHSTTLLEALVSEGLAEHFEQEITQAPLRPWCKALTKAELQKFGKIAEKEFNNKYYDHGAWFYGSKKKGIPRWTGYTLGYEIVGRYLKVHPNKKASNLYVIKAEEFV